MTCVSHIHSDEVCSCVWFMPKSNAEGSIESLKFQFKSNNLSVSLMSYRFVFFAPCLIRTLFAWIQLNSWCSVIACESTLLFLASFKKGCLLTLWFNMCSTDDAWFWFEQIDLKKTNGMWRKTRFFCHFQINQFVKRSDKKNRGDDLNNKN